MTAVAAVSVGIQVRKRRLTRLSGVGALWDCFLRVCGGGGGCAGGGVPLGAVLVLSWCGEMSLGKKYSS